MNLLDAMSLRHDYSDEGFERVEKLEGIVDRYEDRLGTYLVQITRRELLDRQNEDVSKFLHTITDFERISDHALNIRRRPAASCMRRTSPFRRRQSMSWT